MENNIFWNSKENYLAHYGVKGMKWGKKKQSHASVRDNVEFKYYYGKDGKVHRYMNNYMGKPNDMNDYDTTYYDKEGNRHTYYNPTDKFGNPDTTRVKEHVTKEETVRVEKLASDLAKAKNPIDVGKAYVDFALTSVNKFFNSIFKKK